MLYVPIITLVAFSFHGQAALSGGFTATRQGLEQQRAHRGHGQFPVIALIATIISTVIGAMVAHALAFRFPFKVL
jgi:ABC-type spermidine/putrescine transport system permease subunit II